MSGIKTACRFWLKIYEIFFCSGLLVGIFILLILSVQISTSELNQLLSNIPVILTFFPLFILLFSSISVQQHYLPMSLSLGSSRRTALNGIVIMNFVYCLQAILTSALMFLLTHKTLEMFWNLLPLLLMISLLVLFAFHLLSGFFLCSNRLGNTFIIFLCLGVGVGGSVFYILYFENVKSGVPLDQLLVHYSQNLSIFLFIGAILLLLAGAVFHRFALFRYSIHN